MNFLAHIYLSGNDELVKIGNFMADGIRGKQFETYHPQIQKGILLHRAIDTFTDAHQIFRSSTKRLHPNYHHYSGIIVDIFYDHFLAKNWKKYSDETLDDFADNFYDSLKKNYHLLSKKTQDILHYITTQNWLVSYKNVNGIEQILTQMDKRMAGKAIMRKSVTELLTYYEDFENEFTSFFSELITFSNQKIVDL